MKPNIIRAIDYIYQNNWLLIDPFVNYCNFDIKTPFIILFDLFLHLIHNNDKL
jgi:hypothetical protein